MKRNYSIPVIAVLTYGDEDVISTSGYIMDEGDMTHRDIFGNIFEKSNSEVE